MTKQTEALKLALDALEEIETLPGISSANLYARRALKAIREALALVNEVDQEQPAQQEPIWFWTHPTYGRLYKQPPAQCTWVGLTDEDIQEVRENCGITHHAIKTIEAKLREKNT